MKKLLLVIVFTAMGMFKGQSQALVQTYVDRCTGQVSVFTVPMNGQTVVAFYNRSRIFNAQDFQNGTLQSWLEETYLWWNRLNPCSTTTTGANATQQTTQQTTQQAATAASNAAATTANTTANAAPTTTTTPPPTQTSQSTTQNTTSPDTTSSQQNPTTSGQNATGKGDSTSTSGGSGTDSSNQQSNSSTDQTSSNESGSTEGTTQETSSSESQDTTGEDTGNEGSTEETSTTEESTSTEESSTEEVDNTEESTEDTSTEESTEEESTEETSEESTEEESTEEESTEEESEEESTEEESTEEEDEDTENEDPEEKEDNEGDEKDKKKKKKKRNLAPPIVTANVMSQELPTGGFSQAATLGISQSSLLGDKTYGLNLMVYNNLQQFMLNANFSKVHINKEGRVNNVYSASLGLMKSFTTYVAMMNHSLVVMGKKGSVSGMAIGTTLTSIEVDVRQGNLYFDQQLLGASFTTFWTKPFNFERLTVSPMIAVSSPFMQFDMYQHNVYWNQDVMFIGGVNFTYTLTKRFGVNIGTNFIESTSPEFKTMKTFTIGGRLNF